MSARSPDPEKLFDVTLQPIMFVLLFAFGAAIAVPDANDREYMVGGALVQSLGFGMMGQAVSIATDRREGVVDGLRSLPVSSLAAAVRTLFGNPTAIPADAPWPLQHCVLVSAVGSLVLIAIAMPAAIRVFRHRTMQ